MLLLLAARMCVPECVRGGECVWQWWRWHWRHWHWRCLDAGVWHSTRRADLDGVGLGLGVGGRNVSPVQMQPHYLCFLGTCHKQDEEGTFVICLAGEPCSSSSTASITPANIFNLQLSYDLIVIVMHPWVRAALSRIHRIIVLQLAFNLDGRQLRVPLSGNYLASGSGLLIQEGHQRQDSIGRGPKANTFHSFHVWESHFR